MKKYTLLKDTVEVKAGTLFVYKQRMDVNMGDHTRFIPAGYYVEGFVFDGQISAPYYEKDIIENNPEWFEEVIEKGVELTERQIQIQELLNNVIDHFEVNKEKGSIKIKQVYLNHFAKNIESLFNEDHLKDKVVDDHQSFIDKYIETDKKRVWSALQDAISKMNTPDMMSKNQFYVRTEDGFRCTDGDIIYGIAIQASGIDQWRGQKLPFKTPISESRVWFKDKEKANNYLIKNKRVFSILDIVELYGLSRQGISRLESIAKERI